MKPVIPTRGALVGTACALLTLAAFGTANAQTYPPGTNCQSLLPGLRAACINQAQQQQNTGVNTNNTTIPNSSGSNTVPTPGTGINSGTTVIPGGTADPNAVTPGGTVNPNAVGTPNQAPTGNPVVIPPAGTGNSGAGTGTTGSGTTGSGTTGTGTTGGGASGAGGTN